MKFFKRMPTPEMHMYAFAFYAELNGKGNIAAGRLFDYTKERAEVQAMEHAKRIFSTERGWTNHIATTTQLEPDFIIEGEHGEEYRCSFTRIK